MKKFVYPKKMNRIALAISFALNLALMIWHIISGDRMRNVAIIGVVCAMIGLIALAIDVKTDCRKNKDS